MGSKQSHVQTVLINKTHKYACSGFIFIQPNATLNLYEIQNYLDLDKGFCTLVPYNENLYRSFDTNYFTDMNTWLYIMSENIELKRETIEFFIKYDLEDIFYKVFKHFYEKTNDLDFVILKAIEYNRLNIIQRLFSTGLVRNGFYLYTKRAQDLNRIEILEFFKLLGIA